MFPAPFASVVVVAVALALAYVWLGCRCEAAGKDIKELEKETAALGKVLLNEEYRWAWTTSPRNLEKALARHRIVMGWPRRNQIIRLAASAPTNWVCVT